MINKRRSELEIISDILFTTQQNINKTTILFKCNLSYTLLEKYLKFLIERNAIEKSNDTGNTKYKITSHGSKMLKDINTTLSYFG